MEEQHINLFRNYGHIFVSIETNNDKERKISIIPKINETLDPWFSKKLAVPFVEAKITIMQYTIVSIPPANIAIKRCVIWVCSLERNWLNSDKKKTAIFGFKIAI